MERLRSEHSEEFKNFEHQRNKIRRLWNICDDTAAFLFDLVRKTEPGRILEIGTSNGYSTFWLSLASEGSDTEIDTIEIDEKRFDLAKQNLRNRENINLIKGLAEEIIPRLKVFYDLVFIDAGKIGYINYIKLLIPKLNPGAYIVADNVISHKHTVRDYLDYFRNNMLFETETLSIGSGLELSKYNPIK